MYMMYHEDLVMLYCIKVHLKMSISHCTPCTYIDIYVCINE